MIKKIQYIASCIAVIVMVGAVGTAPIALAAPSTTTIEISDKDLNLTGAPKKIEQGQIEAIFNTVYFVVGIVAVISIIIGALRYASANGDSSIIQRAKNTILYSVIGLIVVISAAAVTSFVINNIGKQ